MSKNQPPTAPDPSPAPSPAPPPKKDAQASPKGRIRFSAVALAALGVIFFFSASILLIQSVADITPDRFGDNAIRIQAPRYFSAASSAQSTAPAFACETNCATVILHVEQLHAADRRVSGFFEIRATQDIKEKLWSNYEWLAPPSDEHQGEHVLKEEFRADEAYLTIFSNFGAGSAQQELAIPLGDLFPEDASRLQSVVIPVELPVAGAPHLYPSDWYKSQHSISFRLPDRVISFDDTNLLTNIPFELGLTSDIGLAGKSIILRRTDQPVDTVMKDLDFVINQDWPTVAFVYLMVSVPIILALVLAHMFFFNERSRQQPLHGFLLDAVAVMLAVLPLRAVLVPAEVQGFLRIDFMLAFGIALIVSITLLKYAQEIGRVPVNPAPPGDATPPK